MFINYDRCKSDDFLYSMTNERKNKIVVFEREFDGTISFRGSFITGGEGTAVSQTDPLGSQGSIIVFPYESLLFNVNAGDNTISSFRIIGDKLVLKDVVSSHGIMPNSLAILDRNLYVTNVGDNTHPSNVAGFHIRENGTLEFISVTAFSNPNVSPGSIASCHCEDKLVVSEKGTNLLSVFTVRDDGTLTTPVENPSNGTTPFGSVCASGILYVAEAGPNALSSYDVLRNSRLSVISGSVKNGQSATCWVSITPEQNFAYTSNAGNGTISQYKINANNSLTLIETVPSTPGINGGPLDSALDDEGNHFYVLNGSQGSISVFKIQKNGHLRLIQIYQNTHLPKVGAQGLAIF